jgi:hypothetical protein
MPLSEALEPLRAEVVGAAGQAALEQRVFALVERLLDLCLVDVAALMAGGSSARRRQLHRAFTADLDQALAEADRCREELTGTSAAGSEGATSSEIRSARARRLALASRLERRAARAAAKLRSLRDVDPTAAGPER